MIDIVLLMMLLHGPDGREVFVNPTHISSMRPPSKPPGERAYTDKANCLLGLVDGRNVSVAEDCGTVLHLMGKETK